MIYYDFTEKDVNKKLKGLVDEYRNTYDSIAKSSRNFVLANLKPGEKVPEEGIIYLDHYKDQFKEKAKKIRADALQIIDDAKAKVELKMSEPPTTEMTNLVTMLKYRDDLTEQEVDSLLDKYSDNVQTFRAINSIAKEKGLIVGDASPLNDIVERMDNLKAVTNKMFDGTYTIGKKGMDAVSVFGYSQQVDNTFPVPKE